MGEVAANPSPLDIRVEGGFAGMRMLVAEGDVLVHKVANGLDQSPPFAHLAELRPGDVRQAIGLAIAAAKQIDKSVDGKRVEGRLRGERRDIVGLAAVLDDEIGGQGKPPLRSTDDVTDIAEAVVILRHRHEGMDRQPVLAEQISTPARMNAQREDHRRRLQTGIGYTVACTNFHHSPPTSRAERRPEAREASRSQNDLPMSNKAALRT
jgi:hypothetical protein